MQACFQKFKKNLELLRISESVNNDSDYSESVNSISDYSETERLLSENNFRFSAKNFYQGIVKARIQKVWFAHKRTYKKCVRIYTKQHLSSLRGELKVGLRLFSIICSFFF